MDIDEKYIENYSYESYFSFERFSSYFYQIDFILRRKCRSCAIIGIGDGVVPFYLRKNGIKVTSIDIDEALNPDIICSVTKLSALSGNSSNFRFDAVVCCQVLEHLEYKEFAVALENIKSITTPNGFILISLPDVRKRYFVNGTLPKFGKFHFDVNLPHKIIEHKDNGEHYWEIGKKVFPISKIRNVFEEVFGSIVLFFYTLSL